MALIPTKIANASSIEELDKVISDDKMTDVEAGYCYSRLCRLATAGERNEEEEEEEDDIIKYWRNNNSLELTESQNNVLDHILQGGNGSEDENDELLEWYNVDSLELTYSQELVLESATGMSKATKADPKDTVRAENGAPNARLTLARRKTYYDGTNGETSDEKTEIGEETICDNLQSPPTEVAEVIDSDDASDDDTVILTDNISLNDMSCEELPAEDTIIDLTGEDQP